MDAEEEVQHPQVFESDGGGELRDDPVEQCRGRGGEDDVVDVEEQIGELLAMPVDEERGVGASSHETDAPETSGDLGERCTGRMFESVKGL